MSAEGLAVDGLVINKITPAPDDDETGRGARYLADSVATERERIAHIESSFDVPVVGRIESRVREVRGDLLAEVADELTIPVESGPPA
jgi:arsenite-transporting ATPase